MAKSHLKLVSPTTVKRTVATPLRRPNAELRTREYLTDAEVERLTDAAKANRYGHRDATMVLLAYRHGLRASELVDLRWDQIDFDNATLGRPQGQEGHTQHPSHPRRRTTGIASLGPGARSRSRHSCSRPNVVRRSPQQALPGWSSVPAPWQTSSFKAHPHMLRHACGFALANKGHDTRSLQAYLGHKNIQHTVRYTELSPDRFKDFWR